MKVIQNALLYNKIECYNKGVQRSPFLSKRLHSLLKTSTLLQIQDVWKSAEERFLSSSTKSCRSWPVLRRPSADYNMSAWCKHWRSSSLTKNNGVSRGQNAEEYSDSTRPTGVGRNPSLNGRFCHQKAGSSLIKICKGRIRDLTGDILFPVASKDTIPTAIPTTIPTVTMINPGQCWCVMSNKALTDISRARTSRLVEIFSQEPSEDA